MKLLPQIKGRALFKSPEIIIVLSIYKDILIHFGGNINWVCLMENTMELLKNLKIWLSYYSTFPLLNFYSRKNIHESD